jgi:hypothetical protein
LNQLGFFFLRGKSPRIIGTFLLPPPTILDPSGSIFSNATGEAQAKRQWDYPGEQNQQREPGNTASTIQLMRASKSLVTLSAYYRSLAKYCTTWDCHLWGKYPTLLCDFQAFLPPNSDPSGTIFSKATVYQQTRDGQSRYHVRRQHGSRLPSKSTLKGGRRD